MKVLSIKQPWAWLIVHGYKDIENRTWSTKHRGPFLIHAGKNTDLEAYYKFKDIYLGLPNLLEFPRGSIVGRADLVDCVTRSNSEWFEGPTGFVLARAQPCTPFPWKGKLGFFQIHPAAMPELNFYTSTLNPLGA